MHWCRESARVGVLAFTLVACRDSTTPTTPSPPPTATAVPTGSTGPVGIVFLDASPPPGATITGCGTTASGCRNRLSMRFSLRAQEAGPVLGVRVFLHATNQVACLIADVGPLDLARSEVRELAVVFDQAEGCGVPFTIANMALVVEGPGQVASRQTWSISYTFAR
jgi:hypothetical protein